jgi:hypothetical protein
LEHWLTAFAPTNIGDYGSRLGGRDDVGLRRVGKA